MKLSIKNISIFVLISLILILSINLIGTFFFQSEINTMQNKSIELMDWKDVKVIFENNIGYAFLLIAFSFTGISFILICKVFFTIATGPLVADINPFVYFISSLTHGLGEIIMCAVIFIFSYNQFKVVGGYFLGKRSKKEVLMLYKELLRVYIPLVVAIVFFSALLEVYVSNHLIYSLLNN